MSWSRSINKLFAISKLKLLGSFRKNGEIIEAYVAVTSQQGMWDSWLFNIFKTFFYQIRNFQMCSCSDVKVAFCFAVMNNNK